ncbi:Chromobox protein 2, partial [Egretta garzetta]
IVHYMNRMSQSQNSAETSPLSRLALKSQASSKSGLGLDLKMRNQKGSGELGLSMQGPKTAKAPSGGAGGDQKSGSKNEKQAHRAGDRDLAKSGTAGTQEGHAAAENRKAAALSEMSTGEETSSDSDRDSASFPGVGQNMSVSIQTSQDWKPTRSLIEHVFVTDVTANLITVTVKESPTSVGFFNLRQY